MTVTKLKDTILFVVNPLLERRSKINLEWLLHKFLDHNRFTYHIIYSESPEQTYELVRVKKKEYRIFIAVGGDGTVNNVGRYLIYSDNILGMIPLGSGNGFARSLKISLNPPDAIKAINRMNVSLIDAGSVNDIPFMHMAGVGFCAAVSHRYDKMRMRGFIAYLLSLLAVLLRYDPKEYEIRIGEKFEKLSAFLIAAGNTSQWGYNIHICPDANPADGLIDLNIIHKFPVFIFPYLMCRLILKNLHRSNYSQITRIKETEIRGIGELTGHIDGDPVFFYDSLHLKVLPGSLKVITGN
jgi:diacylglycerol kinase (ATP)